MDALVFFALIIAAGIASVGLVVTIAGTDPIPPRERACEDGLRTRRGRLASLFVAAVVVLVARYLELG